MLHPDFIQFPFQAVLIHGLLCNYNSSHREGKDGRKEMFWTDTLTVPSEIGPFPPLSSITHCLNTSKAQISKISRNPKFYFKQKDLTNH